MTNTMTYKGYTARIEYDPRDEIFVGRVLGIEDHITFHGATVGTLRRDFRAAIDHYLVGGGGAGSRELIAAAGKGKIV